MNIMIGINNKYVFPAKVMLTSLCENNKFEKHSIYVLYDRNNLSIESIKDLKLLEKSYNAEINPIEFDSSIFEKFPTSHHFTVETYFRFLAQDMLPQDVERVLWLDADMIVIKSLKDFYYQDFESKLIVACRTANPKEIDFLENLGLNKEGGYFNAGIILFNLNDIRKKLSSDIFFQCLEKYQDKIVWLDQDILNIVFADDKKLLNDQNYNFTFFSDTIFSKEKIKNIEDEIVVLHYIGGEKPWHISYKNELIKYFRKYARKQERFIESMRFEICHLYDKFVSKVKEKNNILVSKM